MSSHGGATVSSAVLSFKTFFSKKTSTVFYTFFITFVTFTLLLAYKAFLITCTSSNGYISSIFSFNVTKSISSANNFDHFTLNYSVFNINTTLQAHAPTKLTPVTENVTFESQITNLTNPDAENNSSQSLILDNRSTRQTHQLETVSDPAKGRNLDKDRAIKINQTEISASKASGSENLPGDSTDLPLENQEIESLKNCEFYDGEWVTDDTYPLYKPGSCNVIDEQFNCFANGRPDNDFQKFKWKPKNCNLPGLNGTKLLEMIRGRRLAFVGDSLNRNMWESLVCILKGSVKDETQVFEVNGRNQFRQEAEYSFLFKEYECTIEYYTSPFLVQEWETEDKKGTKKKTLRLDLIGKSSEQFKEADIIIFNTGHWWARAKTSKGKNFYQVKNFVYPKLHPKVALGIALKTWSQWIDKNVNPKKSLVFFRSISSTHYRDGQWNSGGTCHNEMELIKNHKYLKRFPYKMKIVENILKGMKTPVTYLNITRLTDYRKDAHPSIYRKQNLSIEQSKLQWLFHQDCSHWCLPGVPDSWNEILYAELFIKLHQMDEKKSIVNITS